MIGPDEKERRLRIANQALDDFAKGTRLWRGKNGTFVQWRYGEQQWKRRWMCKGQDFYPVWSHRWPHGGTATVALSQLVRWAGGRPVLPLGSWRHWSAPSVGLVAKQTVILLESAGYPEKVPCVLCGIILNGGLDWWSLDGVTGPCCGMRNGCKQAG